LVRIAYSTRTQATQNGSLREVRCRLGRPQTIRNARRGSVARGRRSCRSSACSLMAAWLVSSHVVVIARGKRRWSLAAATALLTVVCACQAPHALLPATRAPLTSTMSLRVLIARCGAGAGSGRAHLAAPWRRARSPVPCGRSWLCIGGSGSTVEDGTKAWCP
jgi:hypothetical protein